MSKKFTFKFPASGSSKHKAAHATAPNRHFTDEVERRTDTNSVISSSARDAYRALIDGEDREVFESLPQPPPLSKNTSSLPPHASVHRRSLPPSVMMPAELELAPAKIAPLAEEVSNPLPLPPKDRKSSVTSGRRHIRKNPLIIPSGAAASMARRLEDDSSESLFVAPPPSKTKSRSGGLGTAAAASIQSRKRADNTCGRELETYNDAFEEEIAYSMDALDDLQESRYNSPKTSLETGAPTSNSLGADHRPGHAEDKRDGWVQLMTTQDALDDQNWRSRSKRGLDSDEVRIMSKVLGGVTCDKTDCLSALNITDWNVHKAIKIVKLKGLVQNPDVTDSELKISLMNCDWDVAEALTTIRTNKRQD